jgi:hypothetical protein
MKNPETELSDIELSDFVHRFSRRRGYLIGSIVGLMIGLPVGAIGYSFGYHLGSGILNIVPLPVAIFVCIRWVQNFGVSVDELAKLEIQTETEVSWKVTTSSSSVVGMGAKSLLIERTNSLDMENKFTKTRYGTYQCQVCVTDGEGFLVATMRIGNKKSRVYCYEQGNIESLLIRVKVNAGRQLHYPIFIQNWLTPKFLRK